MSTDRMILGENAFYSTDCNLTGLNNNVIVCGSSGCGKTMSISEACLLETYNSSLITTVTKQRIVKKYMPVFEQRGYTVVNLNFIDPSKSSAAYDPLNYIKTSSDITFLARAIVMSTLTISNPVPGEVFAAVSGEGSPSADHSPGQGAKRREAEGLPSPETISTTHFRSSRLSIPLNLGSLSGK